MDINKNQNTQEILGSFSIKISKVDLLKSHLVIFLYNNVEQLVKHVSNHDLLCWT